MNWIQSTQKLPEDKKRVVISICGMLADAIYFKKFNCFAILNYGGAGISHYCLPAQNIMWDKIEEL